MPAGTARVQHLLHRLGPLVGPGPGLRLAVRVLRSVLAFEGLVAFFVESTFIGLWIFGWTRLPRTIHLFCIWMVAFAVNVSLTRNSV